MPLTTAYLGLGANLGDRLANLRAALRLLEAAGEVLVTRASRAYENRAIGMGEAGPFLNAVAEIKTSLPPERLLEACLAAEDRLGRVRTGAWAPRTIDIDLLLHGDERRDDDERLRLPHPGIATRDFVLRPLADLAPALRIDGREVLSHLRTTDASALSPAPGRIWPAGEVHLIAAVARNGVIGIDGHLPWHIPEDWEVFLKKTRGGTLVMGRVSFLGMTREPSWADDRRYVVVTSRPEEIRSAGARTAPTVADALRLARSEARPIWICGGERVYAEALPLADRLHLTRIHDDFEGETRFPDFTHRFREVLAQVDSLDAGHRISFQILGPALG